MCGPMINFTHTLIIGPLIIVSVYFRWKWPLYILGILAIVSHGYLMHNRTSTEELLTHEEKDQDALKPKHGRLKPIY